MTCNVMPGGDAEGNLILTAVAAEIHVTDLSLAEGTGSPAVHFRFWTCRAPHPR